MVLRAILASFTITFSLFLGFYVIRRDQRSVLQKVFFLLALSLALWSFGSLMAYTQASLQTFIPFFKVSFIFAGLNIALILHFSIILSEPEKHQKKWIFFLLYLPVVVFSLIALFEQDYFTEFYKDGLLWQYKHQYDSLLFIAYISFWSFYSLMSLFVLFRHYWRSETKKMKRQSLMLFLALLAYVLLALSKALLLPLVFDLTSQGGVLALQLIWLGTIAFLIDRYRFMLEPSEAERLALMGISGYSVFLCDNSFKLLSINREAESLLGVSNEDSQAFHLGDLIEEWEKIKEKILDSHHDSESRISLVCHFIDADNHSVAMDCKMTWLKDKWDEVIGLLLTAKETEQRYTLERRYDLSPREIEVIELVVNGYSNRQIAEKLFITERTVKAHITHIFNKLGVENRFQLISKMKHYHFISEQETEHDLLI